MSPEELSPRDKHLLLCASFLALMAAGVGFVFRAMVGSLWAVEYTALQSRVGELFGAGLWPIAIMMILFSFVVDRVGYKASMYVAFALQVISVVLTITASSFNGMWWACVFAGLGHGVVEAVTNPLVASAFRTEKTKYLSILHAAWPAGLVLGGTIYMGFFGSVDQWALAKWAWVAMLLPVLAYAAMYAICKRFPVDERVEAKVPYTDMLKEFGGLGAFLAITFIGYELFNQVGANKGVQSFLNIFAFAGSQYKQLFASLALGAAGGTIVGLIFKSKGKWMFFFLCVLMVPLATAELATDAWIKKLMEPAMGTYAGWALVFSASIMMILRFFAGIPLKKMGPLGLLMISSVFSIIGLFALSYATGIAVLAAFVFYAVGQTFYWPAVLGFTAERFPKGGALTLNTVSAMGLLTVGIFGFTFLGALQDNYNAEIIAAEHPAIVKAIQAEEQGKAAEDRICDSGVFFGVKYPTIKKAGVTAHPDFKKLEDAALERAIVAALANDSKAATSAADKAMLEAGKAKDPEKAKAELKASLDKNPNAALLAVLKKDPEIAPTAALDMSLLESPRRTLRAAAVLPVSMTIGFFLIIMWFRRNGGYKPIVLAEEVAGESSEA